MPKTITYYELFRENKDGAVRYRSSGGTGNINLLTDAQRAALRKQVGPDTWDGFLRSGEPFAHKISERDPIGDMPQGEHQGQGGAEGAPGTPQGAEGIPKCTPGSGDTPGDGEGGEGDGDDTPVMWSDMAPYQDKLVKYLEGRHVLVDAHDKAIQSVSQETAAHAKLLDDLEKQIKAVKLARAKNGGEPPIFKVEIHTPTQVTVQDGLFHHNFPLLVKLVKLGLHVFLPGPPGTGKSHAAEQVSKVLGWKFGSISLGPTTPESRLWGGMDANGRFHEPPFVTLARWAQDNPDNGSIFCMDEIDNGHPGILATVNSTMANGWFTAPNGDIIRVGPNFVVVAAANTYGTGPTAEFAGRNRLDAATLDRFAYLPWETDEAVETTLVHAHLAGVEHGQAVAKEWLQVWRTARQAVVTNNLKVFVTMRGAIHGARMIAGGIDDVDTVLDAVLLSKLPADQADKINPLKNL